jgi:hypothetical protein
MEQGLHAYVENLLQNPRPAKVKQKALTCSPGTTLAALLIMQAPAGWFMTTCDA